jgi:hypothetical protein
MIVSEQITSGNGEKDVGEGSGGGRVTELYNRCRINLEVHFRNRNNSELNFQYL